MKELDEMPEDRHWNNLERRLTAIETGFDAFTTNVNQALREMRDHQHRTAAVLEKRGQTDWAVLFSMGMLLAVVIGGFTTLITSHQDRITQMVAQRSTELSKTNEERVDTMRLEFDSRIDRVEDSVSQINGNRWTRQDQRVFEESINKRLDK